MRRYFGHGPVATWRRPRSGATRGAATLGERRRAGTVNGRA